MSFGEITNGVAVMYMLFLIVVLLMYIAFIKKPSSRKSSKNN